MSIPVMVLQTLLRWLDFVGLTMLVGGLAFRCLIVRPALLSRQEFESFEGRLRRAEVGSILLLALTSIGDLVLRTLMMSDGTLGALGTALPAVLSQTHFGAVWIRRIILIGLLGGAWLLRERVAPRFVWSAGASLLGALLVALTTSLTGHAADWGDLKLPVLIDWLHLLAISTWTGGLFALGCVLRSPLRPVDKANMVQGLCVIAGRFSRMAACCVTAFLATGSYNAWIQVTSISPLVTTWYGWTFLVKLSLVLLVLMIASLNRYYFLPLLGGSSFARDRPIVRAIGWLAGTLLTDKGSKDEEKIRQQFFRSVRLEWLVVVGALACTALLTQLPPARHIRSHQHLEQHATHQPAQGTTTPRWSLAGKQQGGKFPLDRVRRPW